MSSRPIPPNANSSSSNWNINTIPTTISPALLAVAQFILDSDPLVTMDELGELLLTINQTSYAMLIAISAERALYHRNMLRLWNGLHRKWDLRLHALGGSWDRVVREAGPYVMRPGYEALEELVRRLNEEDVDEGDGADEAYLVEIFRYWRRFAGRKEARRYEDVWEYVAGRPVPWE